MDKKLGRKFYLETTNNVDEDGNMIRVLWRDGEFVTAGRYSSLYEIAVGMMHDGDTFMDEMGIEVPYERLR